MPAKSRSERGLNTRGGELVRHATYLLICPACGKDGFKPQGLLSHLRGPSCVAKHSPTAVRELYARAERDPRPWMEHISRITRECDAIEAARKQVPRKDRGGCDAALRILRAQIKTLLEVGPERYEIPRDPPPEIIFPAPPKGT